VARQTAGEYRGALRGDFLKLVRCNGRALQVYEISEPVFEMVAQRGPIKLHGSFVVEDDVARQCADSKTVDGGLRFC